VGKKTEILLRVKMIEVHLAAIDSRLNHLKELTMSVATDLKAGVAKLDAETTAIGALIASLAGRITNSMTDQEVTDIRAALTAESDRLTTLAADPTNPVPAVPAALKASRAKAKP